MYDLGQGVKKDMKNKFIIWKRQPLEVIPVQGTILDVLKVGSTAGLREQGNISSSLPTKEMKIL
jgi:hypothetical protein